MSYLSEADIESALLEHLEDLGYTVKSDLQIGPDAPAPEREAYTDVLLLGRLQAAIDRLNPHIPAEARHDALMQVLASASPSLVEENRRLHKLIVEGVPVEFYANDWLAVAQFTVIENGINRRADVVLFVNGLPLAVIELKNAGDEQATLAGAFNQLQTYKQQVPSLFRTNALLVIADGLAARVGSLTANAERFMPWRTTDGTAVAPKGTPELPVLVEGIFAPARLLEMI